MKSFKIGDVLTVTKYGGPWSSRLCSRPPTTLNYPTIIEIVDIEEDYTGQHIKAWHKESNTYYGFWSRSLEKVSFNTSSIYINNLTIKFLTQHGNR